LFKLVPSIVLFDLTLFLIHKTVKFFWLTLCFREENFYGILKNITKNLARDRTNLT